MTPGCIVQAEGLRDIKAQLDDLNVVVLGVSKDPVKRLPNFVEKKSLNLPIIRWHHSVAGTVSGVSGWEKFMGKIYDGLHRISFLIDEEGQTEQCVFNKFKTKTHHEVVLDYFNPEA